MTPQWTFALIFLAIIALALHLRPVGYALLGVLLTVAAIALSVAGRSEPLVAALVANDANRR
jgi:hypothetical protein